MNTIFISNNWADAHQQTRLRALHDRGVPLKCLAFLRDYYPPNTPFQPLWLGRMAHASYLNRWKTYLHFIIQLSKHTSSADKVYVFGFDLILLVYLYNRVSSKRLKLVYEIPDIREMFFAKGLKGNVLRFVEARIIPSISLLVVTSKEYVTEYFVRLRRVDVKDFLVIENKIHSDQLPDLPAAQTPSKNDKIRIGYFGLLRCRASLDCLIQLAQAPGLEVKLAGIFMPSTRDYETKIRAIGQITYLGPYQSPADLPALYANVDVVWAAYPFSFHELGNHLWARTNRFYESLYFKKPMILQRGSNDASVAESLGSIALDANLENTSETVDYLEQRLSKDFLNSYQRKLQEIPKEIYQITNEYSALICHLLQKR